MKTGGLTDKGLVRENNEDSYGIPRENLFIVADGMGGHKAGEMASRLAVDTLCQFPNADDLLPENICTELNNIVNHANKLVYDLSLSDSALNGMGTTLDVCLICQEHLYCAHVGDSRIYIYRKNRMEQITRDHSLVSELVDAGTITQSQAERHPMKNFITRSVGTSTRIDVDTYIHRIFEGDIILMCTDGLTNMLSDEEITDIISRSISQNHHPQELCRTLIDAANARGGYDNITALIISV